MNDDHLDAETLAAWVDGGLDAKAAAMVETHVSSCDRCQEIVGLIVTTEAQAPPAASQVSWMSRIRAAWLIPLTAGVAAVGLWMIVPASQVTQPAQAPQPTTTIARDEAPQAKAAPFAEQPGVSELKRQQAPVAADKDDRKPAEPAKNKEEKLADQQPARVDSFEQRAREAAPAAAAPAAPPVANAQEFGRLAKALSAEIISPAAQTRWRLLDAGNVEYSRDGGAAWETLSTGVNQQLTAGASPSVDVCWLVGRSGTVLLTTDGRRWQRLAFPETIDLASVVATDARSAQVTAANGTSFRTVDAGASWSKQ